MPAEGILIDIPSNTRVVPGLNFQSHGPMMRPANHNGFTRLPLNPPPPTPPRRIPNGTYGAVPPIPANPPEYHSVPEQTKKQIPQYQEIPYSTTNVRTIPPEEVQLSTLSTSHQSDNTEVDQALFMAGLPHSNSTVPLTGTTNPPPPPAERRPRKKANPLYDSFGNGEVVTTSSTNPPKMQDSCGKKSFRCIKHPITLFGICVIVIANFIVLLLIFTGTVEQLSPGSSSSQKQSPPAVEELVLIINEQKADMEILKHRIFELESLLMTNSSQNATTTAKIAQNTIQINKLATQMTSIQNKTLVIEEGLKNSNKLITTSIVEIDKLGARVEILENITIPDLRGQVNSLEAQSNTYGQDIQTIQGNTAEQSIDISALDSKINAASQTFAFDLARYNDSIYTELLVISKMQGPPGFNGSRGADGSDLSNCQYDSYTDSTSFERLTVGTDHTPRAGFVFTGISCSTAGGVTATLTKDAADTFHCDCDGRLSGTTEVKRFCTIHYWECPIAPVT